MRMLRIFAGVSISVIAFLGCETGNSNTSTEESSYCVDEKFKQVLEFEKVTIQPVTEEIHITGTVETNPDNVIHFVSLVSGVVSKANFSLGDKVVRGQVLAELRSAELSALEAELKNIDAQILVAKKKLETVYSMFEDGISSERDLMKAQSKLAILKTERENVSFNLSLFSPSEEKGVFEIKAPSSGIITAKSIASGTQITAESDPLFTISDLSEVWVMLDIYATNMQNIEVGMELDMTTLSYPDHNFKGEISAISQVLDHEAKVVKGRVVIRNMDLMLKPGMLMDVTAIKDLGEEAVGISSESIVFDDNQNFVVTYIDDCQMEIRKIEILSKSNGTTFIASGLAENETIIVKNQLLIYEQIKN